MDKQCEEHQKKIEEINTAAYSPARKMLIIFTKNKNGDGYRRHEQNFGWRGWEKQLGVEHLFKDNG